MFKKVLIAEDHESTNISVRKTLEDLGIKGEQHAYYCDDGLKKLQIALREQSPFELLITDLYFEYDGNPQQLKDGVALITAAREMQPDLKVLVFSAENKAVVIEALFDVQRIDGYVRKARHDAAELKTAMKTIFENRIHQPAHLRQLFQQKKAYDFSEYDLTIIALLARGMLQKEIPAYLEQNKIRPSGLSSLEKRLNQMREALEFSNNEQLVAFCKDTGFI